MITCTRCDGSGKIREVEPKDDLAAEIGKNVRRRREKLDYTLGDIAELTSLSISLLSQIELGRSYGSIGSLYLIACALNCEIRDLMEGV